MLFLWYLDVFRMRLHRVTFGLSASRHAKLSNCDSEAKVHQSEGGSGASDAGSSVGRDHRLGYCNYGSMPVLFKTYPWLLASHGSKRVKEHATKQIKIA